MRYLAFVFILILTSCETTSSDRQNREDDRQTIKSELEVSLKADREQLAELRKEIPEEKQKSNDEMALFLNLMKQGTEQPQLLRDRYNSIVQKKRTSFRNKATKLRDDYRRDETKRRETFLNEHKVRREDFTRKKHDVKENREFYAEQDKLRSSFFADERDRRQNFESEISSQSKDFESYMRERSNEFNEQYRVYSKQFYEKPKEKKAVTGEAGGFDKLKDMDTTPLGTEK